MKIKMNSKNSEIKVGVHVSIAGNISKAIERIRIREGNIFQIFTRSPRSWGINKETGKLNIISQKDKNLWLKERVDNKIRLVIDHMPYLPNLASPDEDLHNKSIWHLKEEIKRCDFLEIPYLVTHLGSHKGKGQIIGQKQVVHAIDSALEDLGTFKVKLLLENTAGGKNSVGNTWVEIAQVIDNVSDNSVVGVCLDTAHAFSAGYDIRTSESVSKVFDEFDNNIGLSRLNLIHANDSKYDLGEHRDVHWHIGDGKIGLNGFKAIVKQLPKSMPYIAETPGGETKQETIELDSKNIKLLKEILIEM